MARENFTQRINNKSWGQYTNCWHEFAEALLGLTQDGINALEDKERRVPERKLLEKKVSVLEEVGVDLVHSRLGAVYRSKNPEEFDVIIRSIKENAIKYAKDKNATKEQIKNITRLADKLNELHSEYWNSRDQKRASAVR